MRNVDKERDWAKRLQRIGEWVEHLEKGLHPGGLEDGRVKEVRALLNTRDMGDTLLVIKAHDEAGDWVAFVGGRNLAEALLTWRQREGAKGLKWKEDRPWGERQGQT